MWGFLAGIAGCGVRPWVYDTELSGGGYVIRRCELGL